MTTLKTILHHYSFESAAHPEYKAMVRRIEANADGRGHWINSWDGKGKRSGEPGTSEAIEVETQHIFNNQWNTADGRRVFDWYEEYRRDHIKRGHWVEITPEMAQARRDTLKCGYCAKHYGPHHEPAPGPFCVACLDSEYLKPEDIHLLRLLPVIEPQPERAALTEDERAALMPEYIRRQTTGDDSRAKKKRDKQRADVLAKYEKETVNATTERDGMLWLWDHGVSLDNVIYYDHSGKFSFGWRSPLSPEVKSALLDLLCEFPFDYEFKTK